MKILRRYFSKNTSKLMNESYDESDSIFLKAAESSVDRFKTIIDFVVLLLLIFLLVYSS